MNNAQFSFFFVSLHPIMTRLEYWINSQTQYRIHSPFVFEMYRKVLFARLDKELRARMLSLMPDEMKLHYQQADWREQKYHEMVYKLKDHYGMQTVCYDADEAVLRGGEPEFGTLKVVCRPHRCRARELRWQAQQGNSKYNVSIDLFDVGLLMRQDKLHNQHFLLR